MNGELPDQYVITVMKTFEALCNVKVRKATGPDNIPAWLLKNHAEVLAPPLLDRNQGVKIGKHYSQSGLPNGGVPQGTLSGPKCFLVYINDLETPVHLYKYVDDSTLFEVCERNGVSLMQESVDIASKWTEENYMKLNNEKSKEMIISFAKNGNFRHTIPNIKIDGIDVEHVGHAKLLGVCREHCEKGWEKIVHDVSVETCRN